MQLFRVQVCLEDGIVNMGGKSLVYMNYPTLSSLSEGVNYTYSRLAILSTKTRLKVLGISLNSGVRSLCLWKYLNI